MEEKLCRNLVYWCINCTVDNCEMRLFQSAANSHVMTTFQSSKKSSHKWAPFPLCEYYPKAIGRWREAELQTEAVIKAPRNRYEKLLCRLLHTAPNESNVETIVCDPIFSCNLTRVLNTRILSPYISFYVLITTGMTIMSDHYMPVRIQPSALPLNRTNKVRQLHTKTAT